MPETTHKHRCLRCDQEFDCQTPDKCRAHYDVMPTIILPDPERVTRVVEHCHKGPDGVWRPNPQFAPVPAAPAPEAAIPEFVNRPCPVCLGTGRTTYTTAPGDVMPAPEAVIANSHSASASDSSAPEAITAPDAVRGALDTLNLHRRDGCSCSRCRAIDVVLAAVDAARAAQAREIETLRAALERARTLIDRAMGDTDPLDEDDPLLVACQTISAALAARAPEPAPEETP